MNTCWNVGDYWIGALDWKWTLIIQGYHEYMGTATTKNYARCETRFNPMP